MQRDQTNKKLFHGMEGRKVLVLGIGGGGDSVGALPVYQALKQYGALPQLGGLTWKRGAHDPEARPRRIDEFVEIERVNDAIGLAGTATRTVEGIRHVEADIAELLTEKIVVIDISGGAAHVRRGLEEYVDAEGIAQVIAVDVGGDALCIGSEPTIRSPLCDQIMLKALSTVPGALLGVAGLGADGELPLAAFRDRFAGLRSRGAYLGALDVSEEDAALLRRILDGGKSESSACILAMREQLGAEQCAQARAAMNSNAPDLDALLATTEAISLRNGTRKGEVSVLTAMTLFFDLAHVFATSLFCTRIPDDTNVEGVDRTLREAGMRTEFTDREMPLTFAPRGLL